MRLLLRPLASFLLEAAARLMPARERAWLDAMRGEFHAIPEPGRQLIWAAGCFAAGMRARMTLLEPRLWTEVALLLALITVLDWQFANPIPTVLILAWVSAALAGCHPRWTRSIGIVSGLWLLAAHLLADQLPTWRPRYQQLPLTPLETIEISLLLFITLPAAVIGARVADANARR